MNITALKLDIIGLFLRKDDAEILKKIRTTFNEVGIKNTNRKEKPRKVR